MLSKKKKKKFKRKSIKTSIKIMNCIKRNLFKDNLFKNKPINNVKTLLDVFSVHLFATLIKIDAIFAVIG